MTPNAEYWCQCHLVVGVRGPDGYSETVVEKPFARVGTHRHSEVVLRGETVPLRALYLHATPEGVLWADLAEPQAQAAPPPGYLQPGQEVVVGPYRISARATGTAPEPTEERPSDAGIETPPEMLVSVEDRELGRCCLRRRLVLVGRQPPSAIRLSSHLLSPVHCALYWDGDRIWAVDLLSSNGTTVDGRRIEVAALRPGDRLTLGPVILTHVAPETTTSRVLAVAETAKPESDVTVDGHPARLVRHAEAAESSPVTLAEPLGTGESAALSAARLQAQRDELERERAAWEQWKQREKEALASRAAELAAEAGRLADRCNALDSREKELDSWAEKLNEQSRRLEEEAEKQRRSEFLLSEQRASLERAQAELETRRCQSAEEAARRSDELGRQEAQIVEQRASLEAAREALEKEHAALDQRRTAWEAERAEAERKRQEWEAEAARQQEAHAQEVAELERRMRKFESDREALRLERENWQEERTQREAELVEQQRHWQEASAALAVRGEQFEAARAAWDEQRRKAEGGSGSSVTTSGEEPDEKPTSERAEPSPTTQQAARPASSDPPAAPVGRAAPASAMPTSGWRRPVPRRTNPRPRWFLATAVGLLCAVAAGAGAWYAQQPTYTAVARLKLAPGEQWPMPEMPPEAAPTLPEDLIAAPEQLVRCRSVVSAALASYDVSGLRSVRKAGDPAGWLSRAINVDTFSEKGIMRVSLRADDAEAAKALLDAVVGVYVNRATGILRAQRERELEKLDYRKIQAELRLGTLRAQQLRAKAVSLPPEETEKTTEREAAGPKRQEATDLAAQRRKLESEAQAKTELLRGGDLDEQQRQSLQKELAAVRNELAMLTIRQRALSEGAASEPAAESSGGQAATPVETEIARTERLLHELNAQRDQIRQRLSESPIQIVQAATVQEAEGSSLRVGLVLVAAVLGFAIPAWWLAPPRTPQPPRVPTDWTSAPWPA